MHVALLCTCHVSGLSDDLYFLTAPPPTSEVGPLHCRHVNKQSLTSVLVTGHSEDGGSTCAVRTSGRTIFWGFSLHRCMIWCMNILGVSRRSRGAASSVANASASTCLQQQTPGTWGLLISAGCPLRAIMLSVPALYCVKYYKAQKTFKFSAGTLLSAFGLRQARWCALRTHSGVSNPARHSAHLDFVPPAVPLHTSA